MRKIVFRYFSIDENDPTRIEREVQRSIVKNFDSYESFIAKKYPIYQKGFDFSKKYIKVLVGLKGQIIKSFEVFINEEAPYEGYMWVWPPLSNRNE